MRLVRRVSIRAAEERLACRGHRERLAPVSEKTRLTIEDRSTGASDRTAQQNPGTVTAEVASSSLVVPRPGNKGRKTREDLQEDLQEDLHPGDPSTSSCFYSCFYSTFAFAMGTR